MLALDSSCIIDCFLIVANTRVCPGNGVAPSAPWHFTRHSTTKRRKKEKNTVKFRISKQPLPKLITIELNGDVSCGV